MSEVMAERRHRSPRTVESTADAERPSPTQPDPGTDPDSPIVGGRPWTTTSLWILQLVVLALYLVRLATTVAFGLDATSLAVEFSTLALFVVPVVYAALHYGLPGSLLTAGWITVLAVPRLVASVGNHQYGAAWAELMQVVVLDALALVVGQRVSAEHETHRIAESSRQAHLRAEALYRDLFDSNQAPILIVDTEGFVVETNASARRAFGVPVSDHTGTGRVRLVDMIGPDAAAQVLTQLISERLPREVDGAEFTTGSEPVEPIPVDVDGVRTLYRPAATMLGPGGQGRRTQVVFEDVTVETRRHDLMEAYAAQVVLGQEEERRHIAQELHDGPVQSLIHLCRQIDAVGTREGAPADGGLSLSDLRSIVEDTVGELRSIAKGLRPSILDDLGLVASINQMLSEAGERQQLETSFGITGIERRLPPTVELALFRIAQEALSNVERHAAAHRVAVGMDFESGGVRLLVKDDGVGFEPALSGGRSLGLPGMAERTRLIASRLAIHSEPGIGTAVDVWVPATVIDRD